MEIWYNSRHEIKQLIVDGELIIPYTERYYFFCVSIFNGNIIGIAIIQIQFIRTWRKQKKAK